MAIDHAEVWKGVRAALVANDAVTAVVGTRIYTFVPRNANTFPFVRFNQLPAAPYAGIMGPEWVWDHTIDLVVFDKNISPGPAADALKAITAVMEDRTKFTITGAAVVGVWPRSQGLDWEPDTMTRTARGSFQMVLQEA